MINFLNWLDGVLWGLPLIVLMVVTGLYFTIRSGFFQFRYFGRIWRHTAGTIFHPHPNEDMNREGMLSPFQAIVTAVGGTVGFAGCAVSQMVRVGMARAVYSNEAGWGTSPMVHSSAKTIHPVEQGLWGSFEVFFDTFVICSITALAVILSGAWTDGTNGGALALTAFGQGFGTVDESVALFYEDIQA